MSLIFISHKNVLMMQPHGRVAEYPVYKIYLLPDRHFFQAQACRVRYLRCMLVIIHLWFSKHHSIRLLKKKRILCVQPHAVGRYITVLS